MATAELDVNYVAAEPFGQQVRQDLAVYRDVVAKAGIVVQ